VIIVAVVRRGRALVFVSSARGLARRDHFFIGLGRGGGTVVAS